MKLNNSGIRLYNLIETICKTPPQNDCRQCFSILLQVPDQEVVRLLHRTSEMAQLVPRTEQEFQRLKDIEHAKFLLWKNPIIQAFSAFSLTASVSAFAGKIDAITRERLHTCAMFLSRESREKELDAGKLRELNDETKALLTKIGDSELAPDLKIFMIRRLSEICEAIEEYPLFGLGQFEDAVSQIIGSVILKADELKPSRDASTTQDF
jgi:hypothetical protein